MNRLSELDALMATAYVWARRSTCPYLQVGAVLSSDGRVLSTGYNGAPSGMPHCSHGEWVPRKLTWDDDIMDAEDARRARGVRPSCTTAVHAELNAIAYAARYGVPTEGTDLYCTHSPCEKCAQLIISAGVERVFYSQAYRSLDGVVLLRQAGIETWLVDE